MFDHFNKKYQLWGLRHKLKGLFFARALILFALIWLFSGCQGREADWADGLRVEQDPIQINYAAPQLGWDYMGAKIIPVADFYVDARVLAIKRYKNTDTAEILPFDVALGWRVMSDSAQLRELEISQGQRRYYYRWDGDSKADRKNIIPTSSNMHMIPSTSEAMDILLQVRPNQRVRIWGQLVNVKLDRYTLKTSTSRNDTWDGACEIIWVTKIEVIDPTRGINDDPFSENP